MYEVTCIYFASLPLSLEVVPENHVLGDLETKVAYLYTYIPIYLYIYAITEDVNLIKKPGSSYGNCVNYLEVWWVMMIE